MLTRASMGDSRRKVSRRARVPKSLDAKVTSENESPFKQNLTSKVVRCFSDITVSILARQLASFDLEAASFCALESLLLLRSTCITTP